NKALLQPSRSRPRTARRLRVTCWQSSPPEALAASAINAFQSLRGMTGRNNQGKKRSKAAETAGERVVPLSGIFLLRFTQRKLKARLSCPRNRTKKIPN